jgi:hypothetical protein
VQRWFRSRARADAHSHTDAHAHADSHADADPDPESAADRHDSAATAVDISDGHRVGNKYFPDGDTSDGGQGQPVAGLSCGLMSEDYHVHSHLSIFLNGQALAVPLHVGIVETSPTNECTYSLHTHDESGKIHVEAPAPGVFTLGQFFQIWGQPLQTDNIAGLSGMPVVVYLVDDGVVSKYDGALADIELTSHRLVTLQVGTAITEVPNITWNGK